MIAVSDTSVLCYLTLLDCSDILHRRFETILIPTKVAEECLQAGAPAKLRTFMRDQPEWLSIRPAPDSAAPALQRLDPGESAAICLALACHADAVLIDERLGRQIATNSGLDVTGTLGILADAAARGWLNFDGMLERLRNETNFRVSTEVVAALRIAIKGGQ